MGKPETCLRCGGDDLISATRFVGHMLSGINVGVRRNPGAVFPRIEQEELRACVCTECGHVETYVEETHRLRNAYQASIGGVSP